MKPGELIAMWFGKPYDQWFIGPITEVHPRRTVSDNVHTMFEGGLGQMLCKAEEYGNAWVMVTAAPVVELDD